MTNPRVMISGTPSSAPVCLLMATTGTTRPSSERCRRSRSTSSATSPVSVPSIRIRPTAPSRPCALRARRTGAGRRFRPGEHFRARLAPREHARGDPGVLRELAVFAVNRHEVARLDERQHQLQLFLAAVAGHVHVFDAFVHDLRAAPRDVIHHAADRLFVSRDRAGREHDRVVGPELDEPVVVDRDAGERRHRLALRSGREAQHVLRRVVARRPSRESARRRESAGSRAAGRSRSSGSCRARETPPCDRTARRGRRESASGRCSTQTRPRPGARRSW